MRFKGFDSFVARSSVASRIGFAVYAGQTLVRTTQEPDVDKRTFVAVVYRCVGVVGADAGRVQMSAARSARFDPFDVAGVQDGVGVV